MSKLLIALFVLTTSAGLILLKLGSETGALISYAQNRPQLNLNVLSILGIALYGLSFAIYTYLIAKFDLGYIIPLTTALVYIIIFTASYFIFKEVFTITKIIGIALIVGGLIFLNLKK